MHGSGGRVHALLVWCRTDVGDVTFGFGCDKALQSV